MKLNDLFLLYFNTYKNTLSESTYKKDLSLYNKHIKNSFLGEINVKDLTFLDLQNYINSLLDNDYKVKTCKNVILKIKRVLDFALDLEIINKNVAIKVKLPKFDNKVIFNKDYETMIKIINAFMNSNNTHSLFFFFLLHGRRYSEVIKIKWRDIDFNNKTYIIRACNNKIKKNMSYYLSNDLYLRLKEHLLKTDFYRLDDYVFTNPHTKTHYKDLRKAFLKILKNNKLEHIRIHDLRHLIASFSINYLNADINLVSNMLGHTNINTTTRYITINQKLTKNILENIFKRAKNEEQN